MPAWGCGAGMSVSCVCDLPWLQGSWLVRNDRLVHPLPSTAHHLHRHRPIPLTNPPICSGAVPRTYGVFEPCRCLHACPCQSVRFCHYMFAWTSGGKLKSCRWRCRRRVVMSFVIPFRLPLGCILYMHTLCIPLFKFAEGLLAAVWNYEFDWKRLGMHLSRRSNWLRGSLFISCVFSFFVDKPHQPSFSSAVPWFLYFLFF